MRKGFWGIRNPTVFIFGFRRKFRFHYFFLCTHVPIMYNPSQRMYHRWKKWSLAEYVRESKNLVVTPLVGKCISFTLGKYTECASLAYYLTACGSDLVNIMSICALLQTILKKVADGTAIPAKSE